MDGVPAPARMVMLSSPELWKIPEVTPTQDVLEDLWVVGPDSSQQLVGQHDLHIEETYRRGRCLHCHMQSRGRILEGRFDQEVAQVPVAVLGVVAR
eukprot:9941792-Alexandrium_andersonii.AAC.1